MKESQAYLFFSGEYVETMMGEKWYQIEGKMLHHDGDSFGWGFPTFKIPHFTGTKKITSLASFPLDYHSGKQQIQENLVERGRSRGLIGLLSGPPGVGKTLTAEVVAELSRRPLHVISAGELGTTVDKVDSQLGMVLDITRRWGCVLLIDEADVFLFKRGEAQVERNGLVSVFLRRLEYFQGIVILTTNRRKDIDRAFNSRIHFRFHYPALSEADRLRIWQEMLINVAALVDKLQFSDADLGSLAKRPMNGREIKNAVSSVASIVRANKETLTVEVIKEMLQSLVDDVESDDED
ncbi:putative AAA family ATPase [Colletotrichum sublineola]|uniref:Putative AAA family ATPase n=1 Tax=Colletotrichum sublineola TaxID=1173701 RepID=A0A066XCX2_COLSU|nr:putative AAA family ATPase [Colletotrichum sublineola]